jgi:hypothetical protein
MRATAMTTVTRSDSDRPPRADVNNVEARHEDDKENGAVNTAGVKRLVIRLSMSVECLPGRSQREYESTRTAATQAATKTSR